MLSDGTEVPMLRVRRMYLHAQHQPIVLMRTDCHVCRSEGLSPRSQVLLGNAHNEIQALLYQVDSDLLQSGEIALSEAAWKALGVTEGDGVSVRHPPVLESLASVRRRVYGQRLSATDLSAIVHDVVRGRYTDVHLSAFLTASAALPLDLDETIHLTGAMIEVGEQLHWPAAVVVDKHCVGGLPGNRTTPVVVAIAAANGLVMPKTSSRAITSPAGTADTMEMLAPVELDLASLRRVVQTEGACLAWGGAMQLSPADDIFVRIERELDIDTEGQLIASVLSKKIAAGATHVLIDIPVGPTAKVRDQEAAQRLAVQMQAVGRHFGQVVRCVFTDGNQPVGRGIGPALEAHDVLAVLRNESTAPADLRDRALQLAAAVLELGGAAMEGQGLALATTTLDSGRAWNKFRDICLAQGGLREPPRARHVEAHRAAVSGTVTAIDNRRLSRLAKLAGAPASPAAGLEMHVRLGDLVHIGQALFSIHAQTPGELAYARDYLQRTEDIVQLDQQDIPQR